MANSRSAEKEEFWRMAVLEHASSGLTIKAFCKQQGLSEPSFYAWRREIRTRDAKHKTESVTLVPVTVAKSNAIDAHQTPQSRDRIELTAPSGVTLWFPQETTSQRIAEIVKAIGNPSC